MNLHESVYESLPELAAESAAYESTSEMPYGETDPVAGQAVRAALEALAEIQAESEWEAEAELHPARRVYPDAMMEHLAHQAVEAESEEEAGQAFLPLIGLAAAKLAPLALKAAPLIAKAVPKVMGLMPKLAPHLTRGVGNIAQTLFRNPATRPLLRSLPSIAQRTVGSIARQVAAGRPMTPQVAVRTLARQAGGLLRQPARVRTAVRRSQILDARAHRLIRPGAGGSPLGGPTCVGCGGSVMAAPAPVPMPRPRTAGCVCQCPACGR
jgi:hypothetical protein